MKPTADTFSTRLREAMTLRRVNGSKLSKDLDVSYGTVRKSVDGSAEPGRDNFVRICEYLAMPPAFFYPELPGSELVTRSELEESQAEILRQLADLVDRLGPPDSPPPS